MKATTFEAEAEAELNHWWFVGRRRMFARIVDEMALPRDASVLDIGTSTGTNLRMLKELGFESVQGLDLNPEAQRWCEEKGLGTVQLGSILDLPFAPRTFDLVLATDVIEHVDQDDVAVREIHRVLKPGGWTIVTVPAFMSLWGPQDELSEHRRRYRKHELLERIDAAGLEVVDSYYFNYLLFGPIFVARKLLRALKVPLRSENDLNFGLMNTVLRGMFELDTRSAARVRPPFGVSIAAVCRRPR